MKLCPNVVVVLVIVPWVVIVTHYFLEGAGVQCKLSETKNSHNDDPFLRLKLDANISSIFINLGSNLDPILPPLEYALTSLTIAVEPIVASQITPHPLLIVVPAVVSTTSGLASMYSFNTNGVSSSLSLPSAESWWNTGRKGDGRVHVVASITLRQILQALPKSVKRIPYLKTDLQGHDWTVINDTGSSLQNFPVDFIFSEVYFERKSTYRDVNNDFCSDWMPNMVGLGYELVYVDSPTKAGMSMRGAMRMCKRSQIAPNVGNKLDLKEGNALWKRIGCLNEEFRFQR